MTNNATHDKFESLGYGDFINDLPLSVKKRILLRDMRRNAQDLRDFWMNVPGKDTEERVDYIANADKDDPYASELVSERDRIMNRRKALREAVRGFGPYHEDDVMRRYHEYGKKSSRLDTIFAPIQVELP